MRRTRPYLAAAERILWSVAIGCGLWSGFVWQQANAASTAAGRIAPVAAPVTAASPPIDGVLGQLRIHALGLSVPIVEGDDDASLRRGVGHIPGTAFPGGLGTAALAGHRDTFLRSVRRMRTGAVVEVSYRGATYRYQVDRFEVVRPDAVRVLDTTNVPELVIVTCYPFTYIGHAPFRYIVHAHLLSLIPETTTPEAE